MKHFVNTILRCCYVLIVVAAAGAGRAAVQSEASVAPPLFVIRHLLTALRNEPQYTEAGVREQMKVMFPDDIKDYAVMSLPLSCCGYYRFPTNDTALALCQRFDKLGYKYFIEIADPVNIKPPYLGRKPLFPEEIKAIFENTRNCLGVETGESFWGYAGGDNPDLSRWLLGVLKVCAGHKKIFILGEGTWHVGHWSKFLKDHYAELQENGLGQYLVPEYKNTKPWAAHQNISSIYGAWVTGLVGHYGMWNDAFVWMYSSFGNPGEMKPYIDVKKQANQRLTPYTFFLRQWLLGISQGSTYSMAESGMAYTREGGVNDNFRRYLHPFIKAIGDHHITPSRVAVLQKTKAIINPYGTYKTANGDYVYDPDTLFLTYLDDPVLFKPKSYDPFTVLYRNTYGFAPEYDTFEAAGKMFSKAPALPDRLTRDTLPNSSRYYAIPIMPVKESHVPEGMKVLNLAELRSDQAVRTTYNELYPDNPAGNTAYAVEVDNSFFVINSSENTAVNQHYVFNVACDPRDAITVLSGDIGFQNILFGKREGRDDYWFQANGYVGDGKTEGQRYVCQPKATVITFTCSRKPVIRAEQGVGGELAVIQEWTPQNKQITVSCNHARGAVNFRVTAPDDRLSEPLWSHIRTVDDLGELRDVSASFDGAGEQRVLRLQVNPSINTYAWADLPAPVGGWKLNTREAVEMEIRNCGDKPADVMLWVVARHGWDAVGSFATVPASGVHSFRCSLREAFPDGTPKSDPSQVRHLRVMVRRASPGTLLEVRCPVASGEISEWIRPPSRLDVPDMEEGYVAPSAGRRVRYALAGDEKTGLYSTLYLPPEWKKGGRYPVIAEYSGNIFYAPACYSTGRPEQCVIGYGMTKGVGAIWVSLPFVDRKAGRVAEDGWGEADATADYAVRAVETLCRDFGGDSRNVVLTGFSRGAIACGYIGLRNERIAALWKGFHACQHYDGDGWGGADMASALERARHFAGRAVFQTDNPAKNITPLMEAMKAETTFVQSGLHAHACAMFLDDRPSTLQLRAWFQNLMEKQ